MTMGEATGRPRKARWGWGILVALGILLALNGVALYFISASPATFEQDTGVPYAEVQAAYPTVVEHVVTEGQVLSTMLAAIGLMVTVAAFAGYRQAPRWAWWITWILLAMLGFFTVQFLVVGGRIDIGGFYLALAVVGLVGQLLADR